MTFKFCILVFSLSISGLIFTYESGFGISCYSVGTEVFGGRDATRREPVDLLLAALSCPVQSRLTRTHSDSLGLTRTHSDPLGLTRTHPDPPGPVPAKPRGAFTLG